MPEFSKELILENILLLTTLDYGLNAITKWKDLGDDEKSAAIALWAKEQVGKSMEYLEQWGYTIVPREPALDNYPAIV